MRHSLFWKITFRVCVTVGVTVGLLAFSYLLFPRWWNHQLLNLLLEVPRLAPPITDEAAAIRLSQKMDRLSKSGAICNETWEATELEINSLIQRRMCEEKEKLGNGDPDPGDAAVIAGSLSEVQVKIEDGAITIACNVDLSELAPLVRERFGWDFPEEAPPSTVLRATARVTVVNRVLRADFESFKLGNVNLKDSIFAGLASELAEKLEDHLRNKVQSQMPGQFKKINEEEIAYRLPDNVENVEVLEEKIRILFK